MKKSKETFAYLKYGCCDCGEESAQEDHICPYFMGHSCDCGEKCSKDCEESKEKGYMNKRLQEKKTKKLMKQALKRIHDLLE